MGRRLFVFAAAFFVLFGAGCFRDPLIDDAGQGEVLVCAGETCECPPGDCSEGDIAGDCGEANDCTTPKEPCSVAADCPGVSSQCLVVACEDGVCSTSFAPPYEPIDWQKDGDCRAQVCDQDGNVIDIWHPSDVPNDGNPCTKDICNLNEPVNEPFAHGAKCGDGATGVCNVGNAGEAPACVACIDGVVHDCASEEACDGIYCVPKHCVNDAFDYNKGETDPDCGGPCAPCLVKGDCGDGSDCLSGVCKNGMCDLATHFDGVKNGEETGVDCGCEGCPKCSDGEGCFDASHCESSVCYGGECKPASCYDGAQNQGEAGVDCGAPCALICL